MTKPILPQNKLHSTSNSNEDGTRPKGKYFHQMLNMDDDDLGPYLYRLLGHYRRVCGAYGGGVCTESIKTTAKRTRMGHDKVKQARKELEKQGYILVDGGTQKGDTVSVQCVDRMAENIARYDPNLALIRATPPAEPSPDQGYKEDSIQDSPPAPSGDSAPPTPLTGDLRNPKIATKNIAFSDVRGQLFEADPNEAESNILEEPTLHESGIQSHGSHESRQEVIMGATKTGNANWLSEHAAELSAKRRIHKYSHSWDERQALLSEVEAFFVKYPHATADQCVESIRAGLERKEA